MLRFKKKLKKFVTRRSALRNLYKNIFHMKENGMYVRNSDL